MTLIGYSGRFLCTQPQANEPEVMNNLTPANWYCHPFRYRRENLYYKERQRNGKEKERVRG